MTAPTAVQVFGTAHSPDAWRIRDFLSRSVVRYGWHELTSDEQSRALTGEPISSQRLPVVLLPDLTRLYAPTLEQLANALGWVAAPRLARYDLSIFGAGPAGLSAAVYAASEGLRTVVVERDAVGGQAGSSSLIENYLGFPHGIAGAELAEHARQQATAFGAELVLMRRGIMGVFEEDGIRATLEDGSVISARANLCATGIGWRHLGVPREQELLGRGVFYGAGTSEAPSCDGERVVIVGGGNSAGQAVMNLARYAAEVVLVVRGSNLSSTLSSYLEARVRKQPNVTIRFNEQISQFLGTDMLESVDIVQQSGEHVRLETNRTFICIGGDPDTGWAAASAIERDSKGYLVTGPDISPDRLRGVWSEQRAPYYLETSVPGSFAAGDVRHNSVKRVAAAVGEGAMAVTFAHRYLQERYGYHPL